MRNSTSTVTSLKVCTIPGAGGLIFSLSDFCLCCLAITWNRTYPGVGDCRQSKPMTNIKRIVLHSLPWTWPSFLPWAGALPRQGPASHNSVFLLSVFLLSLSPQRTTNTDWYGFVTIRANPQLTPWSLERLLSTVVSLHICGHNNMENLHSSIHKENNFIWLLRLHVMLQQLADSCPIGSTVAVFIWETCPDLLGGWRAGWGSPQMEVFFLACSLSVFL